MCELASTEYAPYHPATYILIEGLKTLPGGYNILSKWDSARFIIDEQHKKLMEQRESELNDSQTENRI